MGSALRFFHLLREDSEKARKIRVDTADPFRYGMNEPRMVHSTIGAGG
jgi:hypothetical protein